MYELIQVAENTYYIDCPAKIGVYKQPDDSVWLIDTGNDKEAGRKINKLLDAQGWTLAGIINTHSNADHCGGNQFLQKRRNCPIYSTPMENIVIANPILESSFLYGAYPPKQLRNKFLMAQDSNASDLSAAALPEGMEVIPLPGHFWDMIGIKTPDNVYFLADCMFGENIIEKYHISFVYDVKAYIETIQKVCKLEGKLFIPAHAQPTEDIKPLAQTNLNKVCEILEQLIQICQTPLSFEEILKRIFDTFSLTMDMAQYVLVGSTIRSYLSYLADHGFLEIEIKDNMVLWKHAAAIPSQTFSLSIFE